MSLLRNSIFVIGFLVVISACGFRPVYESGDVAGLSSEFAAINVLDVEERAGHGRVAQQLKAELEDIMRVSPANSHYDLKLTLNKRKEPMFIEQDRRITRYNMVVTVGYELVEKKAGKKLTSGQVRMVGSYDAEDSDFATYSAEKDTLQRAIKEIARDIRQRLSAYFAGK